MLKVFRDAVCQASLEVCPDKFIGIKLRRVSWEVKGMDSRATFKESLDELGSVDRASIPEKNDRPLEVARQMPEELSDLFGPNVLIGIKPRVKSEPFSFWRDRDGGDGRYLSPAAGDNEDWSFSFDRPGSLDIGNKRESALIQEGQAGSKPSGLFLYAAKRDISSSESLLPGAPWPSSAVSDNSSQGHPSASRDSRCNNALENSSELFDRYALASKDPSSNRLSRIPLPRRAPRLSSAGSTKVGVVLYLELVSTPFGPSSGRSGASAPRSLKKRLVPALPSDKYDLVSTNGRPDAAAFPTFGVCHEAS